MSLIPCMPFINTYNLYYIDLTDLAKTIEEAIYEQQDCQVDSAYKETIRSHILNLKDSRNPLKDQLLSGQVDPVDFAAMVCCIYICMNGIGIMTLTPL